MWNDYFHADRFLSGGCVPCGTAAKNFGAKARSRSERRKCAKMSGFLTNLVIFIVIGLGWYMRRVGTITEAGMKDINAMLYSLLMPVMFFKSGAGFDASMIHGWSFAAVMLGGYAAATVVLWFFSGLFKMPPARRAVSMLTGVRPNAVFIGLPVMTLWLGQAGTEAHLLCIAVGTPYFNVIPLLLAQIALNGKADMKSVRDAFLKTFQNRILLAGLFGLFLGAMGWTPYIPQWVMRTLNVLGNCGNGLAMLAIGAALHPERLLDDVKIAWPDMLMKLFIHPAIIMAAFMLFPAGSPVLLRVTVVGAAVAPAFNCFILARGFGMDGDYAAMLVASSTLLCMGTLLFWMELTTRVFV